MSDIAIRVEHLGKQYRISAQQTSGSRYRYKSLRDTLAHATGAPMRAVRACISRNRVARPPQEESIWALKDASFEIRSGEVVGVIGHNGAGKSTLLKILSRITEPTVGRVEIRGRVGSLLEIGTGFHPELTGRENIYLNGAILGMKKLEIVSKFDEIVGFSGIEKFLDTPVKHYSSGMYMRLAFSVAAHMQTEILIIDEVLAVGDVAFQRKCLGKMSDVAKQGRTVIFVSHNMAAVKSLTTRGVVLKEGCVAFMGSTSAALESYIQSSRASGAAASPIRGRGTHTAILSARLLDEICQPVNHYEAGQPIRLEVVFETDGMSGLTIDAFLVDSTGGRLGLASLSHFHGQTLPHRSGRYCCLMTLNAPYLASGRYSIDLTTGVVNSNWDHYVESVVEFDIPFSNCNGFHWDFKQSYGYGYIALPCEGGCVFTPVN